LFIQMLEGYRRNPEKFPVLVRKQLLPAPVGRKEEYETEIRLADGMEPFVSRRRLFSPENSAKYVYGGSKSTLPLNCFSKRWPRISTNSPEFAASLAPSPKVTGTNGIRSVSTYFLSPANRAASFAVHRNRPSPPERSRNHFLF